MTKKDYILIAKVLNCWAWNEQGIVMSQNFLLGITETLCEALKQENPLFNADKFKEAVWKK